MKTKELQELLDSYQTGTATREDSVSDTGIGELEIDNYPEEEEPVKPMTLYQRARAAAGGKSAVAEDYTGEAVSAGYGTSKYDTSYSPGMDLEQNRALEQGWFSKVGTGLTKGGITALATAANTTAGVVVGAGSALFDLAFDLNGDGRGFMKSLDAGVNNWVSERLVELQNWSEEALPNYRTQEERSEQYQNEWYKHMHTGNFIGDSILKNFGFTIGAMGGGAAWTRFIGKRMTKKLAGDVLKGSVAAANAGDAAASAELARAAEAIRRGTALAVDGQKLSSNLQRVARSINRADARLQIYGATISAMGEGTTEGLMAKNEYLEDYYRRLDMKHAAALEDARAKILASGDSRYVDVRLQLQPDGSLAENPVLTGGGEEKLAAEQRRLTEEYNAARNFAEQEGQRLAATTYLLNQLILIPSNHVQFSRLFSGGWKTSRSLNSAVNGKMIFADGKPVGKYKGKGHKWGRTALNTLKVMGTEANEEMMQGFVSSGAKNVADTRLTAFNDSGYDDEAIRSVRGWFGQMYEGGAEYLSEPKNWQEGFLGALTGLFGIPGRRWHGGVAEAYRDAKETVRASGEAADRLNGLVNSEEFQDRWRGYIRHLKYDNDMAAALAEDDQYAWHTADDNQMISDVVSFAKAGRLEDLNQLVTRYGSINETEADSIREVLKNGADDTADWARNASDKEVVERVKKQADRMKTAIQEYRDIYDALRAREPQDVKVSVLDELVFTAQQIKAIDRRFLSMFGETMTAIDPVLQMAASFTSEGTQRTEEDSRKKYELLRDTYERIFAGSLVPTALPKQVQDAMDSAMQLLEETVASDSELKKKVEDMKKLSEDREAFYQKMQTLQTESGRRKFVEEAATQEKVDEAAEEAAVTMETNELDSLDKVKDAYFSRNYGERLDYRERTLKPGRKNNPHINKFMEILERYNAFRKWEETHPAQSDDPTLLPGMIPGLLNDLLRYANSVDDLYKVGDSLFTPEDIFDKVNAPIFGVKSPTAYKSAKEAVRKALEEFNQLDRETSTRNTLSPKPLEFTPKPGTVAEPTGRDASQPGSLVPNKTESRKPEKKGGKDELPEEVFVAYERKAGVIWHAGFTVKKDEYGFVRIEYKVNTNHLIVPLGVLYDAGVEDKDLEDAIVVENYDETDKMTLDVVVFRPDGTVSLRGSVTGDSFQLDGKDNAIKVLNAIAPEIAAVLGLDEKGQTEIKVETDEDDGSVSVGEATRVEAGIAEASAVDDAPKAMQDEKVTSNGLHYKIPYYRTSVPEIDTSDAKAARQELRESHWLIRSQIQLTDFVKSHPEYATIWNALEQRGAFKYVATKLRVGDEIEFVIDPKFPKYDGKEQILVCTRDSAGKLQVLTTLSYQTREYYGLQELRSEIDSAYYNFKRSGTLGPFYFKKKSRVWALRDGLIDYDYSGKTENAVNQLAGHSEGSVVFFHKEGGEYKTTTVVGDDSLRENNKGVFNGVIEKSKRAEEDKKKQKNEEKKKTRFGTLYYLSPTGEGAIPIALNVRRFNEKNADYDSPTFQRIRESIAKIAGIVREAQLKIGQEWTPRTREFREPLLDAEGKPMKFEGVTAMQTVTRPETREEFEADLNRRMHEELKTLRQDLDFHKWFFSLEYVDMHDGAGNVDGQMFVLRVNNGAAAAEAGEEQKSYLIRPDQASDKYMTKFFTKLNCAIDVRLPRKAEDNEKTKETNLENFQKRVGELYNEGILTTNARMLRPKGADFYFDAWDDKKKAFGPITASQMRLREEQDIREVEEQRMKEEGVPEIPADIEDVDEKASAVSEMDGFDADGFAAEDTSESESDSTFVRGTSETEQEKHAESSDESAPAERESESVKPKSDAAKNFEEFLTKPYEELDAETKKHLEHQGISEEIYNGMTRESRRKLVVCIF